MSNPPSALDRASQQLHELISVMELQLDVKRTESSMEGVTSNKVSCDRCGYQMTLPFEKRCPMCDFSENGALATDGVLPPLNFEKTGVPAEAKEEANEEAKKEGIENKPEELKEVKQPSGEKKRLTKKEKKEKAKEGGKPKKAPPPEPTIYDLFEKAEVVVSQVVSCEPHSAEGVDELWVCKIDIGGGNSRTLCAGLRKHYTQEELIGRRLATILNLTPRKLRGIDSEAMLLAGSEKEGDVKSKVLVIEPPKGAEVGDRVFTGNSVPSTPPVKKLSSKIWEKIVASFTVQSGNAMLKEKELRTKSGVVTCALSDGAEIH